MWTAGLESVILEQDWIAVPTKAGRCRIDTKTFAAKRQVFQNLRREWEADRPEDIYRAFCAMNHHSPEKLHERHAVDWKMLELLRNDPWVEIGAHTVTHPHISTLSSAQALVEMSESRSRLEERLGVPIRHFAFPYGRQADCGQRDFELARQIGYATAATTRKGLVRFGEQDRRFSLPRNTLNGSQQRIADVEVHLTGLGGAVARLLSMV